MAKKEEIKKHEPTQSERFSLKVQNEFAGQVGVPDLSQSQKRLIQNYFIGIDISLKLAEEKRLKKAEKYRDNLPVTWNNINMESLALQVVAHARIGFDPALKNHINMMPFKNNNTNKYDIVFIDGYRGKEMFAKKFALEPPRHVVVELVYENDLFSVFKKDYKNPIEKYEFSIPAPFGRGSIIGGFYYHIFEDEQKNKLVFFTKDEIEKRKPAYASVEFWGGEKAIYENGKKTDKTETVEGWYDKMMWKTVFRAAYDDFTMDSEKIDENYIRLQENESLMIELNPERQSEVKKIYGQNSQSFDISDADEIPEETPPSKETAKKEVDSHSPEPTEQQKKDAVLAFEQEELEKRQGNKQPNF